MRKGIGSRSCRAAIASTSVIVRPSSGENGRWKQKGGARRSACRSHAPSATEPNCRRACDWSGRVLSGTSTRCRRASDGLTELREARGVASSCAKDDCGFVLRPNPNFRSSYIPARPRRSLPRSTTKCNRSGRSASQSNFCRSVNQNRTPTMAKAVTTARVTERRYGACETKAVSLPAGHICSALNAEASSSVDPTRPAATQNRIADCSIVESIRRRGQGEFLTAVSPPVGDSLARLFRNRQRRRRRWR
jgi:hypothetical protein